MIYRSLGVVSDKIAQLSATPYKREILLLRRRRRLLLIIIIGDARGRERERRGSRQILETAIASVACLGAWRVACRGVSSWRLARDRWHRAWRAIDGTVRGAIDGTVRGAIDGTMRGAIDGTVRGAIDGTVRGAGVSQESPGSLPGVYRESPGSLPETLPGVSRESHRSLPETLLERLPETLRRLSRGL